MVQCLCFVPDVRASQIGRNLQFYDLMFRELAGKIAPHVQYKHLFNSRIQLRITVFSDRTAKYVCLPER